MTRMPPLLREFFLGGHSLAVGTASIAASSAILLGERPTLPLLAMAYLFSYGAYTVNRSSEMEQDMATNPQRTQHLMGRKKYLPLIASCCFVAGYALALTVNLLFFAALLLPLLLTFAYSVGSKKLVRYMGSSRLKDKLLVKNVVISFAWSLIPALVGLYYLRLGAVVLPMSAFIFLRLMANTIFFDLRDARGDAEHGVRTIPVVYGTERSLRAMALVDLSSAVCLTASVAVGLMPAYSLVMLLFPLYSAAYRAAARKGNMDFLADVVADSEYTLWGPVVYAGGLLLSWVV